MVTRPRLRRSQSVRPSCHFGVKRASQGRRWEILRYLVIVVGQPALLLIYGVKQNMGGLKSCWRDCRESTCMHAQ